MKAKLYLKHRYRSSCGRSTSSPPGAAAVSARRVHPLLGVGPFAVPPGGDFDVSQRFVVTPGGVPADEVLSDAGKRREVRCSQRLPTRLGHGRPIFSSADPAACRDRTARSHPNRFAPQCPRRSKVREDRTSEKIECARRSDANSALKEPISRSQCLGDRPLPFTTQRTLVGSSARTFATGSPAPRYLSCPRISPALKFSLCTLT